MHRFTILPEEGQQPGGASTRLEQTLAIKRWTREQLGLTGDIPVTVTEFCCADAGCPLLETIIAVHEDRETRTWRLTRPRVAVTKLMIQQTLMTPPERS